MSDPQETNVSENKREEEAVEHDGSFSPDEQSDSSAGEQAGSSAEHANPNSQAPISVEASRSGDSRGSGAENTAHPIGSALPEQLLADVMASNTADNDTSNASMIANDVERMDTEEQRTQGEADVLWNDGQATAAVGSPVSRGPDRLPVRHVYYFVQAFDAESQVLRTVGSFFSRLYENIKSALRQHLHWTEDRDFLIWKRADGPAVTALASGETFEGVYIPDGACFIVRDKLSKER